MKHSFCRQHDRFPRGLRSFTLVELLVVLAIIAILAVATAPAVNGVLGSMNLRGAAASTVAQFDLARQTATTRGVQTEIRFYSDTNTLDTFAGGGKYAYRYTAVVISTNATGAASDEYITPPQPLPGDIIFDQTTAPTNFSTILDPSQNDITSTARALRTESTTAPLTIRNQPYQRLVFMPNSTVNLSAPVTNNMTIWSLTMRSNKTGPVTSPVRPAKNFATIVLDPSTGRVRLYQP